MIFVNRAPNNYQSYDFVICPTCKRGRLCDKPCVSIVSLEHISRNDNEHVILKCPKCGSRFVISTKR